MSQLIFVLLFILLIILLIIKIYFCGKGLKYFYSAAEKIISILRIYFNLLKLVILLFYFFRTLVSEMK